MARTTMDPGGAGVDGQSRSWWHDTADLPTPPRGDGEIRTDVCVVGAGIAGLTTAYLLVRDGRKVAVVDAGPFGGGQTGRTTAHLCSGIDDRYYALERIFGAEGARKAAESHQDAVDRIEAIAEAEGIDCDFERLDGFLFRAPGRPEDELDREAEAARRAGLTGVASVPRAPVESFDTGPAVRFPRQGQFHPLKYLAGLVRVLEARGAVLHAGNRVRTIEDGRPCRVLADGLTVRADAVVVATNTPISDMALTHVRQAPYRTYVVAARVRRGTVPRVLLWDSGDPYHYVRVADAPPRAGHGAEDVLIVGGEDHRTGAADDPGAHWRRLEDWTRARFPQAGPLEARWSGQVMEPVDRLGLIGRQPGTGAIYLATGDSGNGLTHGTIAGILLTDLIAGRANAWQDLYDPVRVQAGGLGEFARHNVEVAASYARWLSGGDAASADEIPPGGGAVVRRGMHKLAVHRRDDGSLVEMSASCTHLGCVVRFNNAEKLWECPCHGSHFDAEGAVVHGPATEDLKKG